MDDDSYLFVKDLKENLPAAVFAGAVYGSFLFFNHLSAKLFGAGEVGELDTEYLGRLAEHFALTAAGTAATGAVLYKAFKRVLPELEDLGEAEQREMEEIRNALGTDVPAIETPIVGDFPEYRVGFGMIDFEMSREVGYPVHVELPEPEDSLD